ncbi:MAG: hypothetical protein AB8G96_07010 [Phycisphaerales bacterium]
MRTTKQLQTAAMLIGMVGAGFVSGAANAQAIRYLPGCTVDATGVLATRATVPGFADNSAVSIAGTEPITSFTSIALGRRFFDRSMAAGSFGPVEGCIATGTADADALSAGNGVAYSVTGDLNELRFRMAFNRQHSVDLSTAGPNPSGSVSASSEAGIVDTIFTGQDEGFNMFVPFLTVGPNSEVVIAANDVCLDRMDSGGVIGLSTFGWKIYRDVDRDCMLSPGDVLVAEDERQVGVGAPVSPSCSAPETIAVPREFYIIQFEFDSISELELTLDECGDAGALAGATMDLASFKMTFVN